MGHISIGRLLALRTPVAWQEAVEVVAAAGAISAADGTPITLDHCVITTDGAVRLSGSAGASGALSSMQLLQALLDGQAAPPELRALASSAGPASGGPSGHPDLSWFLRAAPEAEIGRLAARALAAEAQAGTVERTTRLRAEVSESAPPAGKSGRGAMWMRVARVGALAAVALALIVAVVTTGLPLLSQFLSPAPDSEGASPPEAVLPGKPVAGAAGLPATTSDLRSGAASATTQPGTGEPGSRAADPALSTAPPPPGAGNEPAPQTSAAVQGSREAEGQQPPAVGDVRLYSAADVDVIPPVMTYPRLPTELKTGGSDPTIEVTVDESGQVVHARLQPGPHASVNDRMLVAAAKAWRFHPATRGGLPVRYVMRVPVAP